MSVDFSKKSNLALLSRRSVVKAAATVSFLAIAGSTFSQSAYAEDESQFDELEVEYDAATGNYANSERFTDGIMQMPNELARSSRHTFVDKGNGTIVWGNGWTTTGVKDVGIDVSVWQGTIDWASVSGSIVDYAIIRCGYGSDYSSQDDKQFKNNVRGCIDNGIPFGVYLYSYAKNVTVARSEAQHALRTLREAGVGPSNLAYPVYYDLEDKSQSNLSASELASIASAFCSAIEGAGYSAGVYANKNWWTNKLTSTTFSQWSKWVAQYNSTCTYSGQYDMWQCTSSGQIGGISGNVDVNFDFTGLANLYPDQTTWERVYGERHLETMQAVSKAGWDSSDVVVIATNNSYHDALAASALAGLYECPVLITNPSSLANQTQAEIKRLKATRAFIVGGPNAISSLVDGQVRAAGCSEVRRIYGNNGQATACQIASLIKSSGGMSDTCIIATASSFQDALSVSPYSYWSKSPIFLCEFGSNALSASTLSFIQSGAYARAVIVGGTAAVSSGVELQLESIGISNYVRLQGARAYQTSAEIANWAIQQGMGVSHMGVATGLEFYDALAGGALCGKNASVVVLVSDFDRSCITQFIAAHRNEAEKGYVFGGPAAVSRQSWNTLLKSYFG